MRGAALLLLAAAVLAVRAEEQTDEPVDKAVYKARIEVGGLAITETVVGLKLRTGGLPVENRVYGKAVMARQPP